MPDKQASSESARKLSHSESMELRHASLASLKRLQERYRTEIDLNGMSELAVEIPEVIRGKWLLDDSDSRPSHDEIVSGCGYAFGLVLEKQLRMEWHLIDDQWGQDVALIGTNPTSGASIIFCPFSFTAKKENIPNVEVFGDAFREIERLMNEP